MAVSYPDDSAVTRYSISLVLNPCITDGINVTYVQVELINIINALETSTQCDEMQIKLAPPECFHSRVAKSDLFRPEFTKQIDEMSLPPRFVLDDKFKSDNETGFALDLICVDAATSARIITASKKHNIRVTSFYQAVLFYALKRLYDENNLQLQQSLAITLVAAMRVRFDPIVEFHHCRFFTAIAFFSVESSLDDFRHFWTVGKHIHDEIYRQLDGASIFSVSHNFKGHKEMNS